MTGLVVMQSSGQQRVEFVPQEHTDFIFVIRPTWLAIALGISVVAAVLWYLWRRTGRGGQSSSPPAT